MWYIIGDMASWNIKFFHVIIPNKNIKYFINKV